MDKLEISDPLERERGETETQIKQVRERLASNAQELEEREHRFGNSREGLELLYLRRYMHEIKQKLEHAPEPRGFLDRVRLFTERKRHERILGEQIGRYKDLSSTQIGITLAEIDALKKERRETTDWRKDLEEKRAQEKDQKQQAYEREKARLIRIRDDSGLSYLERGRLEERIKGYRLDHGDDARFRFARQPGGAYENIRSKEHQERQERDRSQRKLWERDDNENKRGRGRSRSRGYDRDM